MILIILLPLFIILSAAVIGSIIVFIEVMSVADIFTGAVVLVTGSIIAYVDYLVVWAIIMQFA